MGDRVFHHGSFRLYILQSLADGPRHGYDIIASLTEQFGGSYRPSPGAVYPRLSKLVNEGLLEVRADGRKRVYSLTAAGRAELERRAEDVASLNDEVNDSVQRLAMEVRARVNESLGALRADLAAAQQRADESPRPAPSTARANQNELRTQLVLLTSGFARKVHGQAAQAAARGTLTQQQVDKLRTLLDSFDINGE